DAALQGFPHRDRGRALRHHARRMPPLWRCWHGARSPDLLGRQVSEHADRAHAELGASSAHRWMKCAGSIALSRGIPNVDSEYAREGTAAHELAEKCLRRDLDAEAFIGTTVN